MRASVPQPCPGTHEFDDSQAEARLRGLSRQQLADRLTWLAWWAPGTFTVVMDYMEFVDNLAANDELDGDAPDDPAPYCTVCGSEVGIFIRFSLNWSHYRTTNGGGIELFDPGHTPEVGWRTAPPESASSGSGLHLVTSTHGTDGPGQDRGSGAAIFAAHDPRSRGRPENAQGKQR